MLLVLDQRLKLPASSNSEFLRKSPPIDLVERSPTPILPLSAAALLRLSGGSFDAIDIKRQSLQGSLTSHER